MKLVNLNMKEKLKYEGEESKAIKSFCDFKSFLSSLIDDLKAIVQESESCHLRHPISLREIIHIFGCTYIKYKNSNIWLDPDFELKKSDLTYLIESYEAIIKECERVCYFLVNVLPKILKNYKDTITQMECKFLISEKEVIDIIVPYLKVKTKDRSSCYRHSLYLYFNNLLKFINLYFKIYTTSFNKDNEVIEKYKDFELVYFEMLIYKLKSVAMFNLQILQNNQNRSFSELVLKKEIKETQDKHISLFGFKLCKNIYEVFSNVLFLYMDIGNFFVLLNNYPINPPIKVVIQPGRDLWTGFLIYNLANRLEIEYKKIWERPTVESFNLRWSTYKSHVTKIIRSDNMDAKNYVNEVNKTLCGIKKDKYGVLEIVPSRNKKHKVKN